jgi:hypothetical protein
MPSRDAGVPKDEDGNAGRATSDTDSGNTRDVVRRVRKGLVRDRLARPPDV